MIFRNCSINPVIHFSPPPLLVVDVLIVRQKSTIPIHAMKALALILFTGLVAALSSFGADDAKPHSVAPKDGFVPNEQTAIQIAVAVWTPIYGKENIERQKPYKVWLKEGIWYVAGHLPKNMAGGVAIAEIKKSDAKIVRISHGM